MQNTERIGVEAAGGRGRGCSCDAPQVHRMEANLRNTFLGEIYHRLGIRGGRKKDIKNDHSVRISVEKNGVLTD